MKDTAEVVLIKMKENATSEDATSDNLDGLDQEKILSGAVFTLLRKPNENGHYETYRTGISIGDSGFERLSLPQGYYQLIETSAPGGYVIQTNTWEFMVDHHGNVYAEFQDDLVLNRSSDATSEVSNRVMIVINHPGSALPLTGGSGTLPYTLGGIALIMASALMYGFRMRRRERRLN